MCNKKSYIILSIKPEFAYLILLGNKTVEFRKNFSKDLIRSKILLYATMPHQAIIGTVEIESIESEEIEVLKEKYLKKACISSKKFDSYFAKRQKGTAIKLRNPQKFNQEIPLKMLRDHQIEAPNSHMVINYQKEPIFSLLQNHIQITNI